jgi:F0F1-type ATP synthase assembly protein I
MAWLVIKYLITAGVVVAVSEFAKRSDRLGALLAALPLVTFLALIWLHVENQPTEKIANHAWYTFWYVLPTLPMFLLFPMLLHRIGFWPTLAACAVITAVLFAVLCKVLEPFGIALI